MDVFKASEGNSIQRWTDFLSKRNKPASLYFNGIHIEIEPGMEAQQIVDEYREKFAQVLQREHAEFDRLITPLRESVLQLSQADLSDPKTAVTLLQACIRLAQKTDFETTYTRCDHLEIIVSVLQQIEQIYRSSGYDFDEWQKKTRAPGAEEFWSSVEKMNGEDKVCWALSKMMEKIDFWTSYKKGHFEFTNLTRYIEGDILSRLS